MPVTCIVWPCEVVENISLRYYVYAKNSSFGGTIEFSEKMFQGKKFSIVCSQQKSFGARTLKVGNWRIFGLWQKVSHFVWLWRKLNYCPEKESEWERVWEVVRKRIWERVRDKESLRESEWGREKERAWEKEKERVWALTSGLSYETKREVSAHY